MSQRERHRTADSDYPIVQDVSQNDGTLYMHDPNTDRDAWAICENPMEVVR